MYTIGDFLIRIKNAYMAHNKEIVFPYSRVCESIGKILVEEGYIKNIKETTQDEKKQLVVTLLYHGKDGALSDLKLVSRPSVHHYVSRGELKKKNKKFGTFVISTNKGIMTGEKAIKEGSGGELLFVVS